MYQVDYKYDKKCQNSNFERSKIAFEVRHVISIHGSISLRFSRGLDKLKTSGFQHLIGFRSRIDYMSSFFEIRISRMRNRPNFEFLIFVRLEKFQKSKWSIYQVDYKYDNKMSKFGFRTFENRVRRSPCYFNGSISLGFLGAQIS